MKKVYQLWRTIEEGHNSQSAPMAVYDTRDKVVNALSALAAVLNTEVEHQFAPDEWVGVNDDDEMPIWNDVVKDMAGATYYCTEQYMAEDGHIIDLIFEDIYTED